MRKLLTFIFTLISILASAQHEASIWYFYDSVSLDFNYYPAKELSSNFVSQQVPSLVSTYTDSTKTLKLYACGPRLYDQNLDTLCEVNNPHWFSDKLIIRIPRTKDKLFIFSQGSAGFYGNFPQPPPSPSYEFKAYTVDLSLNSGKGDTISSTYPDLVGFSTTSYNATYHSNKEDIWLVAVRNIPDNVQVTDSIFVFKISSAGIALESIQTMNRPADKFTGINQLIFNSAGNQFAFSTQPNSTVGQNALDDGSGSVYLYNFNPTSGQISGGIQLFGDYLAESFSENGQFLYATKRIKDPNYVFKYNRAIYQINLSLVADSMNLDSIAFPLDTVSANVCFMQYAPDGSILINIDDYKEQTIARINKPNEPDAACEYDRNAIQFKRGSLGSSSWIRFFNGYIFQPRTFQVSSCLGDSTLFHSAFVDEDSVWWDFGDGKQLFGPTTGIKHLYASPGTYRYALIRPGKDTLFNYAEVLGTQNKFLGPDTLLFSGDTLQLRFQGVSPDNWTWSDNSTDSILTVSQPGTYSINAQLGACPIADTVQVHFVHRLPHQKLCLPDSLQLALNSSQADSLFIQNQVYSGTGSFEFKTSVSGSYALPLGYFKNGLKAEDTLVLQATKVPVPYLGPDSLYCLNESLSISIDTAVYHAFRWENGDSLNASRTIQQSGTYTVQASVDQCTASDTLQVYFIDCRVYVEDTCLLDTAKLWLNLSDSFAVSWTSGSTQQSSIGSDSFFIPNTNSGNTAFTVMVKRGQASRELQGTYLTLARPELTTLDSLLCKNSLFFPYLDSLNYAFLWNTGSNHAAFIPDSSGWHWVSLSYLGCSYTDSFFLNLIECDCPVWVPNAFSPNNNDGLNDQFQAVTLCETEEFLLEIYNRWGQLVYRSANPNEAWDGKYQNINCPSEYYLWRLSIRSKKGLNTEQKGYVFLLP